VSVAISILEALGGVTTVARLTGTPMQTVHSWKQKDSIPQWRRRALLELAIRARHQMDADQLSYLAGGRKPRGRNGSQPA
jgi:hypothetical protein